MEHEQAQYARKRKVRKQSPSPPTSDSSDENEMLFRDFRIRSSQEGESADKKSSSSAHSIGVEPWRKKPAIRREKRE